MKNDLTKEEWKALEQQLSCPDGELGLQVAEEMHKTNIGMTIAGLQALTITNNDSILELGHGNCGHLSQLLALANDIHYTGLEISKTMHEAAIRLNKTAIDEGKAQFELYDGLNIPFEAATFNHILTVNTIYFWKEPIQLVQSMKRVLKIGGKLAISFAQKEFMKELPFVGGKFQLFDNQKIEGLALATGLNCIKISNHTEEVESKSGEWVKREFSVALLQKSQ
ncbi:MAG: class I SAM-dependent methyltransferase [Flammeovirgaceae bacterium]